MRTREETDAYIAEVRTKDISDERKQVLIDEALTAECQPLEHENNVAIIQASIFGVILVGVLALAKYSLLPLLLL